MQCPVLINLSTDEIININRKSFRIGREIAFNDYTLLDKDISRSHCDIYQRDDKYYIRDLFSSNGTYLDGKKLYRNLEYTLDSGSILQFSNKKFLFLISESED